MNVIKFLRKEFLCIYIARIVSVFPNLVILLYYPAFFLQKITYTAISFNLKLMVNLPCGMFLEVPHDI